MKKTFTIALGAVILVGVTAVVTARISLHAIRVVPIPIGWFDSGSNVGNNPGGNPKDRKPVIITNPVSLSAGSTLIFECANNNNCEGTPGVAGSGPVQGNPKVLFELSIPNDLPAGTEMSLSFRPAPGAKAQTSR